MPVQSIGGHAYTDVGDSGLIEFAANDTIEADDFNENNLDLLGLAKYGHLAGVLAGGVCTAAGLVVSVPVGTVWIAGGVVWEVVTSAITINTIDDATRYVWGCADGELRLTTGATTYPASFDARTACLLCKATAASGSVTIDNTVQHAGRVADVSNRKITEGPLVIDYANSLVDLSAAAVKIPVVTSDPGTPANGRIWIRSDLHELRWSEGGTVYKVAGTAA